MLRHPPRAARAVFASTSLLSLVLGVDACGRDRVRGESSASSLGAGSQQLIAAPEQYVGIASLGPKQLALTFDDGPAERTAELSTYLKSQNIRAVFFVNGARIKPTQLPNTENTLTPLPGAAAILAQLTADGHLVGNHTTTHRDIALVPEAERVQELAETDGPMRSLAGTPWNRSLFRAPYGSWQAANDAVFATLHVSTMKHYVGPIYWDVGGSNDQYPNAAADWACFGGELYNATGGLAHSEIGDAIPDGYVTTEECGNAYRTEIAKLGRGIVLMHEPYGWSAGGVTGHTVDMVKYLVPLLVADGYTFVRADEIPNIAADFPPCGAAECTSCSGPSATECTACNGGSFLAGGTCTPCSPCAAGTFASAACSGTASTTCTPCEAGTFALAGAAACTTCGSCDDGDACTVDTCERTAGCAHAPIAGCGETPGSSGASGTGSGGGDRDVDASAPAPRSSSDSGCSAGSGGTRSGSVAALSIGLVAVALRRRRRDLGRKSLRQHDPATN